jgi:hypothetical protein
MKMTPEMPVAAACEMHECVYNADGLCRAAAITIGDGPLASCATMVLRPASISSDQAVLAGVGACRVSGCAFDADLRCTAVHVAVGLLGNSVSLSDLCRALVRRWRGGRQQSGQGAWFNERYPHTRERVAGFL